MKFKGLLLLSFVCTAYTSVSYSAEIDFDYKWICNNYTKSSAAQITNIYATTTYSNGSATYITAKAGNSVYSGIIYDRDPYPKGYENMLKIAYISMLNGNKVMLCGSNSNWNAETKIFAIKLFDY